MATDPTTTQIFSNLAYAAVMATTETFADELQAKAATVPGDIFDPTARAAMDLWLGGTCTITINKVPYNINVSDLMYAVRQSFGLDDPWIDECDWNCVRGVATASPVYSGTTQANKKKIAALK